MDGQWHTLKFAPWSPDEVGGSLYITLHPSNSKNFSVKNPETGKTERLPVHVDCVWLVEQP